MCLLCNVLILTDLNTHHQSKQMSWNFMSLRFKAARMSSMGLFISSWWGPCLQSLKDRFWVLEQCWPEGGAILLLPSCSPQSHSEHFGLIANMAAAPQAGNIMSQQNDRHSCESARFGLPCHHIWEEGMGGVSKGQEGGGEEGGSGLYNGSWWKTEAGAAGGGAHEG